MGESACKLKIILNGGAVQDGANRLCYQVEETPYENFPEKEATAVIEQLNIAENAVNKATRLFLEMQGFKGPWPKSLS